MLDTVAALRTAGHRVTVLFLDAQDAELVKRYDVARRKHPLDDGRLGLVEAIAARAAAARPVTFDAADLVIDTTDLNVHQLKERLVVGVRRRPTRRGCRSPSRASGSSTACRSTPTS